MSGAFLRKYGVAITAGAQSIDIPIIKRSAVDFAVGADWTPAAGDVKISKDGGAAANIATLPAALTMGNTVVWQFTFSAVELQAKRVVVTVSDAPTEVVEDQSFVIETYGDASAMYVADLSAANLPANVTQFGGANLTSSGGIPEVKVASLASGALDSIWASLTSGMTTVGSIGKRIVDYLTGDIYTRIGANGAGLTAIGDTRLANLDATVSSRLPTSDITLSGGAVTVGTNNDKSGYALSASGIAAVQSGLATSAEVTSIQNNTRCVRSVPSVIERPDSGTVSYRIELCLYDEIGNMEAPDSAPTIALVDQAGTDLSARLDSTTMTLVSTGKYRAVYTATSTDDLDQLNWAFSVVEGGNTREYINQSLIVDTTAADFTTADRSKLTTLYDDWINDGRLDNLLDARASQSSVDSLPSTVWLRANEIDANGPSGAAGTVLSIVSDFIWELRGDWVNGGRLDLLLDSIVAAVTSGTYGNSALKTLIDAKSSQASVDTVDTVVDAIKVKTDTIPASPAAVGSAMTLTSAYDLYHAEIDLRIDGANSQDEWTVSWNKNGAPITSGVTSPTIQVVKRSDGSNLIASTALTEIGSTHSFKLDATTTARTTDGEAVAVIVTATIDSATRTFKRILGRDSSA